MMMKVQTSLQGTTVGHLSVSRGIREGFLEEVIVELRPA